MQISDLIAEIVPIMQSLNCLSMRSMRLLTSQNITTFFDNKVSNFVNSDVYKQQIEHGFQQ